MSDSQFITFHEAVLRRPGEPQLGYRMNLTSTVTPARKVSANRIGAFAAGGATVGMGKEAIKSKIYQSKRVGLSPIKRSFADRMAKATDPKKLAKIHRKWDRKAKRREMGNWVRTNVLRRPERPYIDVPFNTASEVEARVGKHAFGKKRLYDRAKRSSARGAVAGSALGSAVEWITR